MTAERQKGPRSPGLHVAAGIRRGPRRPPRPPCSLPAPTRSRRSTTRCRPPAAPWARTCCRIPARAATSSPRVVTDYGLFYNLVAEAEDTEGAETAAGLAARGPGTDPGRTVHRGRPGLQVSSHCGMIVAQVVDAAEELAEVSLATGDWRTAEWAARQGLAAFPCDERMYRILMRTSKAAGNIPGSQAGVPGTVRRGRRSRRWRGAHRHRAPRDRRAARRADPLRPPPHGRLSRPQIGPHRGQGSTLIS